MADQVDTSRRGSARVLELIEWLARQVEPSTLTEVVNELNWPKSSALLLFRLLVERGYAKRQEGQGYVLQRLPGEPSKDDPAWGTLLRLIRPILEAAVGATLETGCIGVLTPESRLRYIEKILPDREIRYDRDIRRTRIPHHTASGLVLLAGLEHSGREAYFDRLTQHGDTSVDALRERLQAVSEDGYAVNLHGHIEGASGVAAPIVGPDGHCTAALNIAGPRERFQKNLDQIIVATIEAAHLAGEKLARRN